MFFHLVAAFWETLGRRLRRGPLRASWSFVFEVVVRFLRRDWEASSSWPLSKVRENLDRRPYPQGEPKKCTLHDAPIAGVPARWFVPPDATPKSAVVVLYLHGGSYIYGSCRSTHAEICARIALGANVTVVGLEYRLAPEHPFPAAHEDALAAYDALSKETKQVILAGDSAGANLAIVTQITIRDRGDVPPPAALISPWTDLEMPGDTYVTHDQFDIGTRATLVKHASAYANGTPLDDPRISPIHASLEKLPPSLVVAGDAEAPYDDILAFVARSRAAGNDVAFHIAKDMPHDPPLFAAFHPSGKASVDAITDFVRGFAR